MFMDSYASLQAQHETHLDVRILFDVGWLFVDKMSWSNIGSLPNIYQLVYFSGKVVDFGGENWANILPVEKKLQTSGPSMSVSQFSFGENQEGNLIMYDELAEAVTYVIFRQ